MQAQNQPIKKQTSLFAYLLILTGLFFLVEICIFFQFNELYLGDIKLVAHHLKIPSAVIPGILFFVLIQILLHLFFVVTVWGLARLVGIALKCSWQQTEKIGFYLWLVGLATILLANQYFFPNSKFSMLTAAFFNEKMLELALILLLSLLSMAVLIAGYRHVFLIFLSGSAVILGLTLYHPHLSLLQDAGTKSKPNIILIGIDALRPDFLGYSGYDLPTPQLDEFLSHSAVFAETLTPLARTFPAWVSILTGLYPKKNGVRFDLAEQNQINVHDLLPVMLQNQGYETIFASDETRFSNIDQQLGFDKVVTPPMGFNDFLLGTLNDFPLSNLLVNTWVGQKLFPYSYGNRPAFVTYKPASFLNLLKPILAKPRNKPVFFAIHFCLPHYPYLWASYRADNESLINYRAAIMEMDQQFADFMALLKQNKLLEHSIVVLLSDHGEAIELLGDRVTDPALFIAGAKNKNSIPHFYPASFDSEKVNQSAGHGTDVLSLTQYHTVLAFQFFGLHPQQQVNIIRGRVSLLDIKPTLLDFLGIHANNDNGCSLLDIISGKKLAANSENDFFIESDFSPEAVRSVHPETRKILFEGIDYYQIDPMTTRLTVKESMGKMIISSKQYADFYHEWVLALYPQNKHSMMPILVNLKTGQWTNDLSTLFAKKSPAEHMLQALKGFYGSEITTIKS